MKQIFIFSCLLFVICSSQAQVLEVSSQIESVTVYPQLAQITRTAEVELPKGSSELILIQLSPNIVNKSLKLSLGANNASIQEISYRNDFLNTTSLDEQKIDLHKQLDSVSQAEKWAIYEKEIIKGEESILNANQRVYSNEEGVNVEALRELSEYYRTRLTELRQKQMEIDLHLADLNKQKQAIQNQINSLFSKNQKVTGEVVVRIQAQQALQTSIKISYLVNNAGWSPGYDIRATSKTDPLDVTFRAAIYQNTGQDWNGIKLSLSNADPVIDNTHPEQRPLYARKMFGSFDTIATFSPETYEETYQVVHNEPESEKWSDTEHKLTSTLFNITQINHIPSNGKNQIITVWKKQIPANLHYLCIPREAPFVYLIAEIVDYGQYQLQAGNANVFNEDTFIGTVNIASGGVTDTLQISLGIDQSISVERIGRDFSEKKWLGTDLKERYEFDISLRNNKSELIDVVLLDQIPISTDKDIEVELLKKDGAQVNTRTGSLKWIVKCEPDEVEHRSFTYSIKYSKETKISGRW